MGVSINGGNYPIAGWFTMENPIYKWMTGGTPMTCRKPPGVHFKNAECQPRMPTCEL